MLQLLQSIALFVIGPPGVGKTTAIRHLVPALRHEPALPGYFGDLDKREITKPKWTICGTTLLAGHYHGDTFDGGDTVPYSGAREALEYWRDNLLPLAKLTIFDGDRFSTQPSLEFVRATGVRVVGVHLTAPDYIIAARCIQRGSTQSPTWMKGRVTKAKNFAEKIGAYNINALGPVAQVVDEIHQVLDNVRRHMPASMTKAGAA